MVTKHTIIARAKVSALTKEGAHGDAIMQTELNTYQQYKLTPWGSSHCCRDSIYIGEEHSSTPFIFPAESITAVTTAELVIREGGHTGRATS